MFRLTSWLIFLTLHTGDGKEPTDRLIPPGWNGGNPWGPAANKARDAGELPPIPMTDAMKKWDRWGHAVLKDGDIVFRRADARVLFGYFPFSRFVANCSGSQFSHTAIVAREGDAVVVYDSTKAGVRRQPFAVWILDNVGAMGVKRLKPDQQSHVPQVLNFCRETYEHQVPFDYDLAEGNDAYYCVEMTEEAFRSAGLKLSDPIRLRDMERAAEFPVCIFVFRQLSSLKLDQRVFFPGNDRHGIWSSPFLETIYPTPPARPRPAATSPAPAAGRVKEGARG